MKNVRVLKRTVTVFAFVLILALCASSALGLSITSGGASRIVDYADRLSAEDTAALEAAAGEASAAAGCDICCVFINGTGGADIDDYLEDYIASQGYSADCVMLALDFDAEMIYFREYGAAAGKASDELKESVFDAYNDAETYYDGVKAYIDLVSPAFTDGPVLTIGGDIRLSGDGKRIADFTGRLSAEELEGLESAAAAASAECGCDVCCVFIDTLGGADIDAYLEKYRADAGYSADCVILAVDFEQNTIYMREYGSVSGKVSDEQKKTVFSMYNEADNYYDGVRAYIDAAIQYLTGSTQTIPATRQKPLLVDDANLLTEQERASLEAKLEEISTRQGHDVSVVTVNSLGAKSVTAFTDDFYDYNGYGQGDDKSGIMFLISMSEREWHITTTGRAIQIFTDRGQQYITDTIVSKLSNGDYYEAFDQYADLCDQFMTKAEEGEPYDIGNLPKSLTGKEIGGASVFAVIVGLISGGVVTGKMKSKVMNVRPQKNADTYVRQGTLNVQDGGTFFVGSHVNRTRKPEPSSRSSGGGGGSSTHTSSSGSSHGGSSGRF